MRITTGTRHVIPRASALVPLTPSIPFVAFVAFAFALAALARPALARPSTLERLAVDFQADAAPALRALLARDHRVALAVDPSLPKEAASAAAFVDRLARRLAVLPPESADAGEPERLTILSGEGTAEGEGAAGGPVPRSREAVVHAARREGWSRVLRVEVFVREGRLVLLGEILATDGLLWEPVLRPVAGITAHFYAADRLDAELRGLLGLPVSPLPTAWDARPLPVFDLPGGGGALPGHALALAVGDVDADGDDEILAVTRTALHVFRQADGVLRRAAPPVALAPLAGVSRARSRVPLGAIALLSFIGVGRADEGGVDVVVTTSDLASSVVLSWRGDGLRPLPAGPDALGTACAADGAGADRTALLLCGFPVGEGASGELLLRPLERGRATFRPLLDRWQAGAVAAPPATPVRGAGVAMLRRWLATAAEGAPLVIDARLSTAGLLRLDRAASTGEAPRPWQRVRGVGTAFALFDANDDGVAELAGSSSAPPGASDALTIWTFPEGAGPREVWRSAPAGLAPIEAIAAGDVDHDGTPDLIVATHAPHASDSHLLLVTGRSF